MILETGLSRHLFTYLFSYFSENSHVKIYQPRPRVTTGYTRRGRPSKTDQERVSVPVAANVDAVSAGAAPAALDPANAAPEVDVAPPIDGAPVAVSPMVAAPVDASAEAAPDNAARVAPAAVVAPVAHAAMNGSSGKWRKKKKNAASQWSSGDGAGADEYQALLQEARDHHSECPIFEDPELGKLTNLNLFNPNKRSKAMPQEVGSKTKMAKDLFHNYLKVVTLNK
ncbi:unnamed protein product [Caenorhabditis nigoni]